MMQQAMVNIATAVWLAGLVLNGLLLSLPPARVPIFSRSSLHRDCTDGFEIAPISDLSNSRRGGLGEAGLLGA
jgi:hypothetical protein